MTAIVTFVMPHNDFAGDYTPKQYTKEFFVGDKPSSKWKGIKPKNIESIELSGEELAYAKADLGAADVCKNRVLYYGDEACRIFFNW